MRCHLHCKKLHETLESITIAHVHLTACCYLAGHRQWAAARRGPLIPFVHLQLRYALLR
jgi:hypothetical protein